MSNLTGYLTGVYDNGILCRTLCQKNLQQIQELFKKFA